VPISVQAFRDECSGSLRLRLLAGEHGMGRGIAGSRVQEAGLAITGLGLLAVLGTRLVEQPWLLVALAIYTATMAIAIFIQRPGLRALVGLDGGSDDPVWRQRARRGRYVSYAMAGLVGTIAFLMTTKPELW